MESPTITKLVLFSIILALSSVVTVPLSELVGLFLLYFFALLLLCIVMRRVSFGVDEAPVQSSFAEQQGRRVPDVQATEAQARGEEFAAPVLQSRLPTSWNV
jgi:hypothetical protein